MSHSGAQLHRVNSDRESQLVRRAEAQHGVFSGVDLAELQLLPRWRDNRLAQGRIVQVRHGAYRFAGTPLAWRGELLAAVWAGGPRGRASHRSSAALLGLTGGRTGIVEITCPRWRRARHDNLVVHETEAFDTVDTTVVDCIPSTTTARTLLDLGAVLSSSAVEYALDHALRQRMVTRTDLRCLLDRVGARGRNGAGVLRRLIEDRVPGRAAESVAERQMVRMLVANGLPHPVLQHEVRHEGRFVARVDAAYPQWMTVIEYESFAFHTGDAAHVRDNRRINELRRAGWSYVPVTRADITTGCIAVAATIRSIRDGIAPPVSASQTTRS